MRTLLFAVALCIIAAFDAWLSSGPMFHLRAEFSAVVGIACAGAFNVGGIWWAWIAAGEIADFLGGRHAL